MEKFIIFDTEYTAWEGSRDRQWSNPGEHREIIQIGAVKVFNDGVKFIENESFSLFVKPILNYTLSDYIKKLTNISQSEIDNKGCDFKEALLKFHTFCEKGDLPVFSWGDDIDIIKENCLINQVDPPYFEYGFFDVRTFFQENKISIKNQTSGTISAVFNETPSGHPHNAIHDARSIMIALNHVVRLKDLKPKDFLFSFLGKNKKNSCSV